eukprot:2343246-Prymnesium_polylepis.1
MEAGVGAAGMEAGGASGVRGRTEELSLRVVEEEEGRLLRHDALDHLHVGARQPEQPCEARGHGAAAA